MASVDDKEDLLLSCRYGELDQVQHFVATYGAHSLPDVTDDNGNTALHMACANGHEGEPSPLPHSNRQEHPHFQLSLTISFLSFLHRCCPFLTKPVLHHSIGQP